MKPKPAVVEVYLGLGLEPGGPGAERGRAIDLLSQRVRVVHRSSLT